MVPLRGELVFSRSFQNFAEGHRLTVCERSQTLEPIATARSLVAKIDKDSRSATSFFTAESPHLCGSGPTGVEA